MKWNVWIGARSLPVSATESGDRICREGINAKQGQTDTLFAIVTHRFDHATCRHIADVGDQLRSDYEFIVYHDVTAVPPDPGSRVLDSVLLPFDFEKIRAEYPLLARAQIVPGNQHLVHIALLPLFPDIKYFWFVEYDVRFSGDWRTLLDICSRSDADMLGCHVRTRDEIPDWAWWTSIQSSYDPTRELPGVRAFTWAIRLSRRALELVARRCVEEGWTGHMEGLIPSLLNDSEMTVEDIGGRGPFTPKERRGLFYSSEYGLSCPSRDGDFGLGSNRYGPPLLFYGMRKNRIYHPVKTNRDFRTIKCDIRSLLAYEKDSALDLVKRSVARLQGKPGLVAKPNTRSGRPPAE